MIEWLNLYVDVSENIGGPEPHVLGQKGVTFSKTKSGGFLGIGKTTHNTVTILETDRSGAVLMEGEPQPGAYGDAEVYLILERGRDQARFLSAPLHTPVTIKGLTRILLVIVAPVGWPGAAGGRGEINAHCVFETKMDVDIDGGDPWTDALGFGLDY